MAAERRLGTLCAMRWFDLKVWAACALAVSACSDDGLSASGTEGGPGATAAGSSGGSPTTGAVTTADPTTAGESDTNDPSATTDPTGVTTSETDSGGSTGADTTGPGGSSTGGESGSSTGGTTDPECTVDEDCMVVDDCCTCDAIPVGDTAETCEKACIINMCASHGIDMPQAECNFGTCEIAEVACDPLQVACDQEPPECQKGFAPRVVDGCWGNCVPVEFCDVVPSCDACGENEACVESSSMVSTLSCVPIPPSCDGVPSCDCLGEACEAPFDTCSDDIDPKSGAEIGCACIAC